MINKPINPAPFNKCISNNSEEILRCDIPNNKLISASYTTISEVSSGETVFSDYKTYDTPQSSIEYYQKFDTLKSGNEYYWNTQYWQNPDKDGVKYNIIEDCEKGQNKIFLVLPSLEYVTDLLGLYSIYNSLVISSYDRNEKTFPDRCSINNFQKGDPCLHFRYDYNAESIYDSIYENYLKGCLFLCDESGNKVASSGISGGLWNYSITRKQGYLTLALTNKKFLDKIREIMTENTSLISPGTEFVKSLNGYTIKLYKCLDEQMLPTKGVLKFSGNKFYNIITSDIDSETTSIGIEIYPPLQSDYSAGDLLYYYSSDDYDNVSPDYYFRCKSEPQISITSPIIDGLMADIKGDFGINYSQLDGEYLAPFNYFQLYFSVLSDEEKWESVEKSPKIFDINATYSFNRFENNRKYKVYAICVDNDGDEWVSDEVIYKVEYEINHKHLNDDLIFFNNEDYTININLETILKSYSNPVWEIYKIESNAVVADYAGGGSKVINHTKFKDYNIRNNVCYTYFVRIEYDGKIDQNLNNDLISGIEILSMGDVSTDFDGTCIIGLIKNPNGTYEIDNSFNLKYYIDDNSSEISQELSRDYISGFDRFQKEFKGVTNFIRGSSSGLLGNDINNEYFEPDKIRDKWLNFVNDDTLKLYKGFDGETMLISISSSRIKPLYFNGVGIVNEVGISWQQIGTLENTAIFETYS